MIMKLNRMIIVTIVLVRIVQLNGTSIYFIVLVQKTQRKIIVFVLMSINGRQLLSNIEPVGIIVFNFLFCPSID